MPSLIYRGETDCFAVCGDRRTVSASRWGGLQWRTQLSLQTLLNVPHWGTATALTRSRLSTRSLLSRQARTVEGIVTRRKWDKTASFNPLSHGFAVTAPLINKRSLRVLNNNLAIICTPPSCHSERSEESRSLPFCPGIKDEILRHFVPQNDKKENFPFSND